MSPSQAPARPFGAELRDLVFHSSGALTMRAVRSLSSFVFNLVLARMLGAGGTGAYFLALGVTELATLIARAGMDATVVRFLAGGEGRSRGFYHRVLVLVTSVGLLMAALVWAGAPFICLTFFAEPKLIEPLRIMAIGIIPWSLIGIHSSFLQSAGKIGLSIFIHTVALFLAAIPFLLLFAWRGSLEGAAFARVAATISVLIVGVTLWRRTVDAGFALSDRPLDPERWRAAVGAGLSLSVISLLTVASSQADIFLLGALATMEDVGTFRVAFRIAVLGGAALEAVRAAVAPRMAAQHSRGDWQALEQTGRAAAALAAAVSLPYWLLVLAVPRELLSLFGSEFTTAATATMVLILGRIVNTITGPVGTMLTMAGLERPLRNMTVVITLARIALLSFAIPFWGVMGAAVVASMLEIASNTAATIIAQRKLGIVLVPLPRRVLPFRANAGERK